MKPFDQSKPKGRRGVIQLEVTGSGLLNRGAVYQGVAEVIEVESAGGLSHIKLIKLTGMPAHARDRIPEWWPTNEIIWIDQPTESEEGE